MRSFFRTDRDDGLPARQIAGLLLLYAILICSRTPHVITESRFWAEEGKVFYHNAATMPAMAALWNSYAGYLNLIANGAPLLAWELLPVEYAPYMTTAIGLLFQLLPPFLLLTARDEWLRPPAVRLAAIALLLFVPSSAEIWLQTLHCQIELALASALVLILEPVAGRVMWLRLAVLLLAPLAGPGSIVFLLPFLLRFAVDRTRTRFFQFLALGLGAGIQLAFFFHSEARPVHDHWFSAALAAVFCREPLQLFFGLSPFSRHIIMSVRHQLELAPASFCWAEAACGVFFAPFLAASLAIPRYRVCFWILLANAAFTGAALFGSLGGPVDQIDGFGGERYIVAGQSLCAFMILAFAARSQGYAALGLWVLVIWMLGIGLSTYWHPWINANGYPWRTEVQKWRADHSYPMRIWPDGWEVTLP